MISPFPSTGWKAIVDPISVSFFDKLADGVSGTTYAPPQTIRYVLRREIVKHNVQTLAEEIFTLFVLWTSSPNYPNDTDNLPVRPKIGDMIQELQEVTAGLQGSSWIVKEVKPGCRGSRYRCYCQEAL